MKNYLIGALALGVFALSVFVSIPNVNAGYHGGFSPEQYPHIADRLEERATRISQRSDRKQNNYIQRLERLRERFESNAFYAGMIDYFISLIDGNDGYSDEATRNIVEVAVDSGAFPTLVAALQAAALDDDLASNGSFTVFAPTEKAFANLLEDLDLTAEELLGNTDLLETVLLYHVLGDEVTKHGVKSLPNGSRVETLQGEDIIIQNRKNIRINGSKVIDADIRASNGVIHVIDEVLLPPSVIEALGEDAEQVSENIVEVAVESGAFPTLVAALQAANLDDDIANGGPFTVYAPTEEAFADLLSELDLTAEELLANKALLIDVLTYHVVPARYTAEDILGLSYPVSSPTLNGKRFTVDPNNGQPKVNDSNIIDTNIFASNGVIHVIDKVLLP